MTPANNETVPLGLTEVVLIDLGIANQSENSLSSNNLQKIKDGYKVYNKYCNFNFIKSLFYLSILSFNFITKKKWI